MTSKTLLTTAALLAALSYSSVSFGMGGPDPNNEDVDTKKHAKKTCEDFKRLATKTGSKYWTQKYNKCISG